MKKTIFISGAISTDKKYKEKFAKAEQELFDKGYVVLSPARLPSEGFTYEQYMSVALAMLTACDAVYFLPDWRTSRGARFEHLYAQETNMEMIEDTCGECEFYDGKYCKNRHSSLYKDYVDGSFCCKWFGRREG